MFNETAAFDCDMILGLPGKSLSRWEEGWHNGGFVGVQDIRKLTQN